MNWLVGWLVGWLVDGKASLVVAAEVLVLVLNVISMAVAGPVAYWH